MNENELLEKDCKKDFTFINIKMGVIYKVCHRDKIIKINLSSISNFQGFPMLKVCFLLWKNCVCDKNQSRKPLRNYLIIENSVGVI